MQRTFTGNVVVGERMKRTKYANSERGKKESSKKHKGKVKVIEKMMME